MAFLALIIGINIGVVLGLVIRACWLLQKIKDEL